jgi:hypothetical protein
MRPIAMLAVAAAVTIGLSAPLTPGNLADAGGSDFEVANWTDPDGKQHRIRWNPCQSAVTYAVNPRLAGATPAARDAAVADVRLAFKRATNRTGVPFSFAGRTSEIPRDSGGDSWSDRQKSAEIVVAWVDQSRPEYRSNMLKDLGGGYPSGVGGWNAGMWTDNHGNWHVSIGRGFVVMNAAHNSIYKPGFGRGVTRGALLLHEIGHAVGLGHVGKTSEIMYPTMLTREHSMYKEGDRTGLAKVGRPLGCIPGATSYWPQI